MEWYPQPQKGEIFRGQGAMDCPWCRQPVVFNYKTQEIAPARAGTLVYQRDEQLATNTATLKNYTTLEAFLVDPHERRTTTPFRFRYWPNVYLPIKENKP